MTIMEAIKKGTIKLKINNISEPNLKSRLLMQFILNKDRQYVIVNDTEALSENSEKQFFLGIQKLENGYPLEHITHKKEFMKMDFFVDENVLIPREDTEILVEEVIKIAKENNYCKILDLCTGSGIIGISLAKYLPNSKITATDISNEALKVAKKNAISNNVEDQIIFVKSDLFSNLTEEKYDIIVSNPPYIENTIIQSLEEQVKKEPYIALDGGKDGLDFYRKIINESYRYLKYKGYLCLEIGYNQKDSVLELIEKEGFYEKIYSKKDLYGNDRIIVTKVKC